MAQIFTPKFMYTKDGYKKILLSIALIFQSFLGFTQFFEGKTIPLGADGVSASSVAFSDTDGDGDEDIVISGWDDSSKPVTKMYTNHNGVFNEAVNSTFQDVAASALAFADVDNDGDEDMLVTGLNQRKLPIAKLYINHKGSFKRDKKFKVKKVAASAVAFADIDNDGDQDLLMSGLDSKQNPSTSLYLNHLGTFTKKEDTPFAHVAFSSIVFTDVDDDGWLDVFISGLEEEDVPISRLYLNHQGDFDEDIYNNFIPLGYSSIATTDIDNDGDQDVIFSGINVEHGPTVKLYTNQEGQFSLDSDSRFEGVFSSSILFSDVDSDGDQDLIISGLKKDTVPSVKLYDNFEGSFLEIPDVSLEGLWTSSMLISDIDQDGDEDILMTGLDRKGNPRCNLYRNSIGFFTLIDPLPFLPYSCHEVIIEDIDNNGYEDILMRVNGNFNLHYKNEFGNFVRQEHTLFDTLSGLTPLAFIDIDQDGDQDLIYKSLKSLSNDHQTFICMNEEGNFIKVDSSTFGTKDYNTIESADINGDGVEDLVFTYFESNNTFITTFINTHHAFVLQEHSIINQIAEESLRFFDFDNDGDDDLLISGYTDITPQTLENLRKRHPKYLSNIYYKSITYLYENIDGKLSNSSIISQINPEKVIISDFDKNGFLDLLLKSKNEFGPNTIEVYSNENGSFYLREDTPFEPYKKGVVTNIDIDNDGDQDVLFSGTINGKTEVGLYLNYNLNFSKKIKIPILPITTGIMKSIDINNDRKEDLILFGTTKDGIDITEIHLNQIED